MITEFEERTKDSTKLQFTVSRSSLPNLLEWIERLQARFGVDIAIQWELDAQAAGINEAIHVRWVSVRGDSEDCKKAKEYITVFCDAMHKMHITYPEGIHTELKESQQELEERYSSVVQFLKVGQLLAKSNDEMNLSYIVSVIEDKDVQYQKRNNARLMQSVPGQLAPPATLPDEGLDDYLDVDSMIVDSNEPELKLRSRSPVYSQPSDKDRDLLEGGTFKLKCKDNAIIPGQLSKLFPPASSASAISPDRKKIKAHSHPDEDRSSQTPSPNFLGKDDRGHLFSLHLSSRQMLAIQRSKASGDFTQSDIDRVLHKAGSDWQVSDLITMLQRERNKRGIPPAAATSRHTLTAADLETLKFQQESLMQSLWEQSSPDPGKFAQGRPSKFSPKSSSTPSWTDKVQTSVYKDGVSMKDEPRDPRFSKDTRQLDRKYVDCEEDGVISLDETDSIIIIPSESEPEPEPEIVIGDSSEESDTQEEFYIKGILQEKPKKTAGRRLAKHRTKPQQFGHGLGAAEKEKQDKLHGVIESLRQQVTDLQNKLEQDRAEASNQQQAATLVQQTQREEKERQYVQQHQQLLEQQQELQKQFEVQEMALKQMQQQQQQQEKQRQAKAMVADPSEAIVIAPARRTPASSLRPVVIDGSNVAMSHGRGKVYSCRGIAICIQYFQKRGHQDITVFVPQGRRTQNPNDPNRPMKDQPILEMLEKQDLLSFTPSRRIGSIYVNCYDDRFIVKLAVENDGVIVSNDNFRDLMGESPKWKYVIENRLVMYTFAGDHFMIPDDPLGRTGPRIDQILQKSKPTRTVAASLGRQPLLTAPAPAGSLCLIRPGLVARMGHIAPGMVPQYGFGGTTSAATSHVRPQYAPLTSAGKATSKPAMAPSGSRQTAQWGRTGMTGAQVVKQGATTSHARPQSAAPSTSTSTRIAAHKPQMTASVDLIPAQGPRNHPCYKTLMGIFPSNEEEVLRVLAKNSRKEDANELVIQVLVEKEKSEA